MPSDRARDLSVGLGRELRRRRLAMQMSQNELSPPLTRGYISQVERGITMPSLAALVVMSERLGTSADEVLRSVNQALSVGYAGRHEDG